MKYDQLPQQFQNEYCREVYNKLHKKNIYFLIKRIFDINLSLLMIFGFSFLLIIISLMIKMNSKGPILYKQVRITKNMKEFKIWKFRTMIIDADKVGTLVTVDGDKRITSIGKVLRKYRIDELPQLFNVLFGQMSFVGPRPEVKKYVDEYNDEMFSTLLIKAGITCPASIEYKDEDKLLNNSSNVDETYVKEVLPGKMKYNFDYIDKLSLCCDLKCMINTGLKVLK